MPVHTVMADENYKLPSELLSHFCGWRVKNYCSEVKVYKSLSTNVNLLRTTVKQGYHIIIGIICKLKENCKFPLAYRYMQPWTWLTDNTNKPYNSDFRSMIGLAWYAATNSWVWNENATDVITSDPWRRYTPSGDGLCVDDSMIAMFRSKNILLWKPVVRGLINTKTDKGNYLSFIRK